MIPELDRQFLCNYNEKTQEYIYKLYLNLDVNSEQKPLQDFVKNFAINFDVDKMYAIKDSKSYVYNLLKDIYHLLNNYDYYNIYLFDYNGEGYSFISFTMSGFEYFVRKLSRDCISYIKNQNPLLKYEECIDKAFNMPIVKRFMSNESNRNNKLRFLSNWYSGANNIDPRVQWCFLPEDLPEIISQLKCVLIDNELDCN